MATLMRVSALIFGAFATATVGARAQQTLPAIEVAAARPKLSARTRLEARASRVAAPARIVASHPATNPGLPAPAEAAANRFAAATVLSTEDLRRAGGATLGDALFDKPGVTGSGFAPGAASRPIVRGLDNFRVRIQENGTSAGGVSELGEDHSVPLDTLGARRIEVTRGPATLRYGAQAMGGLVSVVNNRIPDAPPCADRGDGCAAVETRGAVSTVNAGQEGAALLDAARGPVALHLEALGRRAEDYRVPGPPFLATPQTAPPFSGLQPNSAARSGGATLGGAYIFERGFVGAAITQFDSLYHIPGLDSAAKGGRIALRQLRASAKGEFRPHGELVDAVRFWASTTDYRHHELARENSFDGVQQSFASKDQELRVETELKPLRSPLGVLTTTLGVHAMHQRLVAPGVDGGLLDPARGRSVAGFAISELALTDALRLQAAGRIERAAVDGSSPDLARDPTFALPRHRAFTPKSGAIALALDLPEKTIASVSATASERAPRAPELYSRGAHEATGTFDIGDPNLGVERAKTVEIGLKRATGGFHFEATAFLTHFEGFIFRSLTGQNCDGNIASCKPAGAGGDLKQAVYAQRDATFRGGEFFGQLDLAPIQGGVFGVENQFDIVRASFSSGGNVPRIPPARLGGGLFWRDANWQARIKLLHAFAQNNVAPNETPTPGYNLLKAEISYTLKRAAGDPRGQEMTIGVVGDNLLNEDIRNHVSFRKDEVLMPGRNVRLFANFVF